jgi:hypothetical protein
VGIADTIIANALAGLCQRRPNFDPLASVEK